MGGRGFQGGVVGGMMRGGRMQETIHPSYSDDKDSVHQGLGHLNLEEL